MLRACRSRTRTPVFPFSVRGMDSPQAPEKPGSGPEGSSARPPIRLFLSCLRHSFRSSPVAAKSLTVRPPGPDRRALFLPAGSAPVSVQVAPCAWLLRTRRSGPHRLFHTHPLSRFSWAVPFLSPLLTARRPGAAGAHPSPGSQRRARCRVSRVRGTVLRQEPHGVHAHAAPSPAGTPSPGGSAAPGQGSTPARPLDMNHFLSGPTTTAARRKQTGAVTEDQHPSTTAPSPTATPTRDACGVYVCHGFPPGTMMCLPRRLPGRAAAKRRRTPKCNTDTDRCNFRPANSPRADAALYEWPPAYLRRLSPGGQPRRFGPKYLPKYGKGARECLKYPPVPPESDGRPGH